MRHLTFLCFALILASCGSTRSSKSEATATTSATATSVDSSSKAATSEVTKVATTTITERATTTATIEPALVQRTVKPDSAQTFESEELKVVLMPTPTGELSVTAFRKPVSVPVNVDRVTTQATQEKATEAKSERETETNDWASASTATKVEETKERKPPGYTWWTLAGILILSALFLVLLRRERRA